jgi:putative transposase
LYLWW